LSDIISSRLREERVRISPKQGDFAALIGVRQSQLSDWERGGAGLKAEHLVLLSQAGIDISYVLTGRRGGSLLSESESMLLDAFQRLDAEGQKGLLTLLASLARRDQPATVHDNRMTYRGDMND